MSTNGRVISAIEIDYNTKDPGFYLDTRLTAIVNGTAYDFMGKSIFSVGFFRQGVGFGITNIDIEVNTSLQPIVTITFKDLYGNAVFGKNVNTLLTSQISQSIESSASQIGGGEATGVPGEDLNFSVLFNWPPPKFLFTFKGYLGKQVSWLLNLKKTSTTYQSDGSYDIKCEFVPNQWGFMADLPFLFLLATKGLKKKELNEEAFKKVRTVFDLIKIGKQVEIKTKETTKEFDVLLKQMTLLKANRIVEAINVSKVIKFDEPITGAVGNLTISGSVRRGDRDLTFSTITIKTPSDATIGSSENLKKYTAVGAESLRRANIYLLLTSQIGKYGPKTISKLSELTFDEGVKLNGVSQEAEINQRISVITDNITLIEEAIKQKTYDSSKTQLEQITIGEVFGQLAQDAGYIMGKILEAGFKAYKNNKGARDSARINGKQYPLVFDKTEEKKEIPATGLDLGVEEGELAFVDSFITAISEGIAKDLLRDDQAGGISDENRLIKRINNAEAIRGNPYAPFYRNIAENIMVRAGIIAYLTRSNDPNFPGDYKTTWGSDRDSIEEVTKLAGADMENITTGMLSSMTDEEFLKLKQFCIFWTRFISPDGSKFTDYVLSSEAASNALGTGDTIPENPAFTSTVSVPTQNNVYQALDPSLLNKRVAIEVDADRKVTLSYTLPQIISQVFSPKGSSEGSESFDASNATFINFNSLHCKRIFNNGIIWEVPEISREGDRYTFVIWRGPDSTAVREVNNASSDAEVKSQDPDAESFFGKNKLPAGIVPVDQYNDSEGAELVRVENINSYFGEHGVLKYENMVNPRPELFKEDTYLQGSPVAVPGSPFPVNDVFTALCQYPSDAQLVDPNGLIEDPDKQIPATNLSYAAAFHWYTGTLGLVFGPFFAGDEGTNHRVCIRHMCQVLLDKMNQLEEEKNKIISEVLGKGTEQREAMYKQFHVLYHQWESLMYEDPDFDDVRDINSVEPDPNAVANNLEKRYAKADFEKDESDNKHKSTHGRESLEGIGKNSFIYDYPLNKQANIDVRNAIINLEPLYRPNGNTTVLNIIQQVCTKNNFTFIPIPGNGDFSKPETYFEIYRPHVSEKVQLTNYFYVMFAATPQERSTISNEEPLPISNEALKDKIPTNAYEIKVGSVDNKVIKGLNIDTNENKTTAESIVNLQRLVDKENQNKTVTTDCSMLPVMEGRSYKASFDMIGNAQIFPMQYFFLNSIPLFNGLYQVLKVKHNIKPNDMTTTAEGIRMRFDSKTGDFGGIPPVTLETLSSLNLFGESLPRKTKTEEIREYNEQEGIEDVYMSESNFEIVGVTNVTEASSTVVGSTATSTVSTSSVTKTPYLFGNGSNIKGFGNVNILLGESDGKKSGQPFKNFTFTDKTTGKQITYTAAQKTQNTNEFIKDILEPFAEFLYKNYPDLYKYVHITSTARAYVPKKGASNSQHMAAQAVDFLINKGDYYEINKNNALLMYAILQFYDTTGLGYDQILWETRQTIDDTGKQTELSCWIHWAYSRNHKYFTENVNPKNRNRKNEFFRFVNDSNYKTLGSGKKYSAPASANDLKAQLQLYKPLS